MKKCAIFIENGFQDAELLYPYYRMKEAGFEVDLIGDEKGKEYVGMHGYPLRSTHAILDVSARVYDVLIIPGGKAPASLRTKEPFVNFTKESYEKGLVIAAICHGPLLLIEANIVNGKKCTCYKGVREEIVDAGAEYLDEEVVVDGNLVTSRQPGDLPAFMKAVLEVL